MVYIIKRKNSKGIWEFIISAIWSKNTGWFCIWRTVPDSVYVFRQPKSWFEIVNQYEKVEIHNLSRVIIGD